MWKQAGLHNGSKGQIKDILINGDHTLKCFLIEFDDFIGEGWNNTNLVPIEPEIIVHENHPQHYRMTAPIELADALTIYKI